MDHDTFWRLIEKIDQAALEASKDKYEAEAVEPLVEALAECGEGDIKDFESILAKCLYELDGEVYADQAGESGESGDAFLYARCYVVAKGKLHYDSVKADPAMMPKTLDQWCEALLAVASKAWAIATGKDEDDWDHHSPVSYETGSNKAHWS